MRNVLEATTLESKFPLLAVEYDCILSKDGDITVGYKVILPELFTVTSTEYEAMHASWLKAIKVLPNYSIIHKQDWFVKENYKPATNQEDMSFLSRSFERHFNERPYLNHTCFLFLTKTTKERMRMQSDFSTLCRGNIIPKEVNKDTAARFLEAVGQFERIVNDSGFITLTRLTSDEITGTKNEAGLIEKYFALSLDDTTCLEDMELGAEGLRIGARKYVCILFPMWRTCLELSQRICVTKNYRPTEATAVCLSPHLWACYSPATMCITSTYSWTIRRRTYASLKNPPAICNRYQGTVVETKLTRSGSTNT